MEIDKLILGEVFRKILIDLMRLMRISTPCSTELKTFLFYFTPFWLSNHELSAYFLPPLLPVNPGIKNHDYHIINSNVAANQAKPIFLHASKLVLILNESIIVKFIFIQWTLMIKLYLILRTQLVQWYHWLLYSLYVCISTYMSLKGSHIKAIWALLYFCDLDVLRTIKILPYFCMLYLQLFWNVRNSIQLWLFILRIEVLLTMLIIDEF